MAIPRNLANFANQLNTSGESPKIQVGDSKVEVTDTGSNGTIVFNTDNAERMRINSNGRVGIGVTPAAWESSSNTTALQIKNTSIFDYIGEASDFGANFYYDGGYKYIASSVAASRYSQSSGIHNWLNAASGTAGNSITWTERARIPAAGGFQCVNSISVGNATPTTSGAGITFPATQSASTDANTLDDYEEGTWTPVIIGSGGQSGQAYSVQSGTYTKIGRTVTVRFVITLSTEGTFSGTYLLLSGLPFTIAGTPSTVMGGSLYFVDMATNYISINLQGEESGTRAYLWAITAAATSRAYVGTSDLTNTSQLSGTMTYFV